VLHVVVSGYERQYAGLPAGRELAAVDPDEDDDIVQPAHTAVAVNAKTRCLIALRLSAML